MEEKSVAPLASLYNDFGVVRRLQAAGAQLHNANKKARDF